MSPDEKLRLANDTRHAQLAWAVVTINNAPRPAWPEDVPHEHMTAEPSD